MSNKEVASTAEKNTNANAELPDVDMVDAPASTTVNETPDQETEVIPQWAETMAKTMAKTLTSSIQQSLQTTFVESLDLVFTRMGLAKPDIENNEQSILDRLNKVVKVFSTVNDEDATDALAVWCTSIENFFDYYKNTPFTWEERFRLIQKTLGGEIKTHVKENEESLKSLDDVILLLKNRVCPKFSHIQVTLALREAGQVASLEKLAQKFREVEFKTPDDYSPDLFTENFHLALQPDVRSYVLSQYPTFKTPWRKCLEKAQNYISNTVNIQGAVTHRIGRKSNYHINFKHPSGKRVSSTTRCYNCNGYGHYQSECKKPKKNNFNNRDSKN